MGRIQENYPEITDIKSNVNEIKSKTSDLARHVKEDGREHVAELATNFKDRFQDLKQYGRRELNLLEQHVVAKPTRSVAYAFLAGIVASVVFGRK